MKETLDHFKVFDCAIIESQEPYRILRFDIIGGHCEQKVLQWYKKWAKHNLNDTFMEGKEIVVSRIADQNIKPERIVHGV